ncbi:MAG: CDC48 family AAA ATPase [Candidatus Methanomethylophilus sp.]|nr:CDC48 family AAA ATPase [Methanomethylophilus sp.]
MEEDYLEMRVDMAKRQSESGYGRARIDPQTYSQMGLHVGGTVEIVGKHRVVAKVFRSDDEDAGTGIIRIDGLTRTSAGVSPGETVKVRAVEPEKAVTVTLEPKIGEGNHIVIDDGFQEIFKKSLIGRPVITGLDIMVPNISLMGYRSIFTVAATVPTGPVVISSNTALTILEEPVKRKSKKAGARTENSRLTTYDDIGGLDDELRRIREMIELPLKHPELFERMGISAPKGVLLYGPPGTGKTLIAEALANESGASFYTVRGPEIMSKFFGDSEGKLREIFETAQKTSPSIIFLDEIDSIAPNRENVFDDTGRRIVAQLLTLMDGMGGRGNVIVIGATNRENDLDPALRRPGRFDREIEIGIPGREGRKAILGVHTRTMPLAEDVDLDSLARATQGFVGADLAELAREAAMKCLGRSVGRLDLDKPVPKEVLAGMKITMTDFTTALADVEPSGMREVSVEIPKVTWADVGGLDSIRREISEVLVPTEERRGFERLGITPGRGVLLYGPPGTGKTLIAKAVANESGANFILVNGPEIASKWMGESELAIRKIFKRAKQMAPSIIFFDEIDSVAPSRGGGQSENWERVVAQLLTSLDGVESLSRVLVMAATNRPDMLDPALLRPGRIDRKILVGRPDLDARVNILKIHTRQMPLASDVDLKELATRTDGYVGADLAALCREAGLAAYREDPDIAQIAARHFDLALRRVPRSVDDQTFKAYEKMSTEIEKRRDRWNDTPFYG